MAGLIDGACRQAGAGESGSRSAARVRLAAAIEELAAATSELAAAQESATRLAAIINQASERDAQSAALRAADEQRLGAWLAAGGADARPERSPESATAEESCAALARDAAAARSALPAAEQEFQRCVVKTRELQRRRDEAVCAAAFDAARDFADGYRAALATALEYEAVLHGLRDELWGCANRADTMPGALAPAARVAELIIESKRTAAVRRNPEPARRLLAILNSDPDARLQKENAA